MVHYRYMSSIVGKRQGGQTYYYLVTSARVEGKPRIVSQQYLGSTAEVMAKLAGTAAGEPLRTQHKKFGDLAAVWSMLERLDVAGAVDAVAPRRADAAASVGTYIALATANRIVAPCSIPNWRAVSGLISAQARHGALSGWPSSSKSTG